MRVGYRAAQQEDFGFVVTRYARERRLRVHEADAIAHAAKVRVAFDVESGALIGFAVGSHVFVDRPFRGQGIEERLTWPGS